MTEENKDKLSFPVDYAKVIHDDETVCLVEMDILHLGLNRNKSVFTKESVEASLDTIYNKPIITIYNCEMKNLATDYTSHARDEREAEKVCCVGVIPMPEYSNPRWVTTDDGFERLRVNAIIWKYYSECAVNILKNKDGESKVSIEVLPVEDHRDANGNMVFDKFLFMSCFMLGDDIPEGMQGSKLTVTKFSYDEIVAKSSEYLSKFSKTNEDSEDIFEKLKRRKGGNKVKLGHKELENKLWVILSGHMFERDKEVYHKYYIEDIYDGHIVVRDNETNEEVKFKYNVDDEGVVHVDFSSRKVIDKERPYRVFAKEDIGTEDALKIDKDRLSDDAWGSIDKGELRERVVKAKNFKTIADDVFLDLREGWEDGEVSKLKYPVMQLDGDTLIYNRGALASAKGYAEKNNETEVLEKLKKIYKHLELDFEAEDTSKVAFECGAKDYECDDEDHEEGAEEFAKDKEVEPETKEKEEPSAGPQDNKDAEDAKDDEETRETETKEKVEGKVEMSADANVDAAAQAEMLEKQAEINKDLADENEERTETLEDQLAKKEIVIADLKKIIDDFETELKALRKFKADTEERQKLFTIESVLSEVKDDISEVKRNEFKELAKTYSLDNIDVWANAVKAEAFKSAKEGSKKTFQRMDMWDAHETKNNSSSLWNCVKE